MNCRKCGADYAPYFFNAFDREKEKQLVFYLCPDCQLRFVRLVERFLGESA